VTLSGNNEGRLLEATLDRRLIVVGGGLDHAASTELCAVLMALDGRSPDPVTLRLSSTGGPISEAMTIVDTIGAMRAPVTTIATGAVVGPAIAILAVSTDRVVTPTATLRPATENGPASDMSATDAIIAADAARDELKGLTTRLASATSRSTQDWANSFTKGELITPDSAIELGLATRIDFR